MRGDILLCEDEDELAAGSPPRARGHPHRGRRPHDDLGLTPACAGTSSGLLPPVGEYRAHPRVRGDIPSTRLLPDVYEGSPPRARGHPSPATVVAGVGGLTPACAGTSTGRAPSTSRLGAHPRVRGDIAGRQGSWGSGRGSPPRARGHLGARRRAGMSRTRLWGWSGRGAHPRVRGDVPPGRLHRPIHWGSPPRARGRRVALLATSPARGLTPACAGTSTVHALEGSEYAGSPPRARGRRCVVTIDEWPSRAHPRVRGDVPFGR